ncbi:MULTISPECIES: indolepyruvate oxidoreductase subunit beta [unclassified Clostridioides]|uniref:indolepyruvate oxidoreductase subunit beta n=1 Tax=unclassified Clostridioides TaxID=2635829 RepID=UPI001D0FE259|nr:indolepyruvate oxidoreductase subunit beta [Clostridioides sp. ZZV14-6150]MCC0663949.1 indolepyruvate oxidoreductase subunit beta [Clostridioides sp. ZZV15-6597]MCC0669827.1 indolepyruvate oxidoreductase subunit beta [Clostridioides sp. ZZV14-6153]MCC0723921.1 indolepyruvate oxidoreductase subunit beta [Clostridioides sp. ZZV14-6104]MCC0732360.1 indolepyruvate oxidoreductase subunit beta [Clostridioides sp. ZZV14-6048]MCC0740288.1 indolepyruvate oxidoreductase subunit beta [Clostridioides s
MKKVKNVLLSGVGGQGTVLASKILSAGLIDAGYDVKMSEVHGMAQRGGSVTTQVRYGEKVHSPILGKGDVDVLVSFETMEALRYLDFLKPDGKLVVNDYEMPSAPILTGRVDYPENIIDDIKEKVDVTVIKAVDIARGLGNEKVMNVVLLGALIKALQLENDIDWEKIVSQQVKPKFIEINIKALREGMNV